MSELKQLQKALEKMGSGYIKKSAGQPLTKVERAIAITKASQTPEGQIIAKRICQLEGQRAIRKSMGIEIEDDITDRMKELEREHAALQQKLRSLRSRRGQAGSGSDDEWSSMFQEV